MDPLDPFLTLPSPLTPEQADALAEPAAGPDSIVAQALALPAPWRDVTARQALGELARASQALGGASLQVIVWAWRLFPVLDGHQSEDPAQFLSRATVLRSSPNAPEDIAESFALAREQTRRATSVDWDAFSRQWLPSLRHPVLARSILLAFWEPGALRSQHLNNSLHPGSRHAGDFLIGPASPMFIGGSSPRGQALMERILLEGQSQDPAPSFDPIMRL